ncbi:MAG TPA: hypothetical protein VJ579_01850 [Candidatus Paceibacterota bacterium]|nr:hypothetical protein [Candidatus Paceibacterota bacterium]
MQATLEKARTPARFFPLATLMIALFLIPIVLQQHHVSPALAEANWLTDGILDGIGEILAGLAWVIFKVVGLVFALSAYLFDFAIDFSTRGSTYSGMKFINIGWTFARDLVNSTFIFAVLAIAFKQLLSLSDIDTSGTQKALKNLVIAALLINFSLFFTKVVIDASNMVARGLYYKVSTTTSSSTTGSGAGQILYGPAHALADGLNLQSALDQNGVKLAPLNRVIIYLGGALFMMITTLIFFASAFMFIVRIGILMILMLTSPLYFLSYTLNFSAINKIKSEWTNALQAQALFPIIFLLITYVTVVFVRTSDMFGVKGSGASLAKALTAESGSFSIIINYIIITLLMVMALKYSKAVGGQAASYGSKLSGLAMGKISSGAAWAGRSTIGAAGGALSKSQFTRDMINRGGISKTAGNLLVRGGEKAAQSSFDVRASRAYGFAEGQMGGMGAGKAGSRTFAKDGSGLAGVGAVGARVASYGTAKGGKLGSVAAGLGSGLQVAGGGKAASENALKAREAELVKDIVARYGDDPRAAAAMLQTTLGMGKTRFEGDEGKDARKAVVGAIEKQFKDNPVKQKEALTQIFGDTGGKKEFKEINDKINSQIRTEESKGLLNNKDHIKEAAKYDKNAHKDAQEAYNRATTAEAKQVAKEKLVQIEKQQEKQKALIDAVRNVKTDDVATLDVETLDLLAKNNALNAAHLGAIEKLILSQTAYTKEQVDKLDVMAKELRKTGSEAVKTYLANSAVKGTSGFNIDFKEDLTQSVTASLPAAGASRSDADKNAITETIKAMDAREIKELTPNVVFDPDVLRNIHPGALAAYVRSASDRGDSAIEAAAEKAIADIDSITTNKKQKEKLLSALSGKGGKKKK